MLGQGMMTEQFHPVVDAMADEELTRFMSAIKANVDKTVDSLPGHQTCLERYCPAAK